MPPPPAAAKARAKRAVVRWVVEAMKPHNAVENAAFKEMMQAGIDIGSSFGPVDAEELLPKRTCVRDNVISTADEVRAQKIPHLRRAMQDGACGACVDMWVEKFSRTHYLALTASYVVTDENGKWQIETIYLFLIEFDEDETSENIKAKIVEKLNQLNITEDEFNNVTFVSDNGSNVKKALAGWARHYCLAHALNIVVRSRLELKYHELLGVAIQSSPEVERGISACDEALRKIKSLLKKQLDKKFHPLRQHLRASKRQHNSYWEMLESLRSDFDLVSKHSQLALYWGRGRGGIMRHPCG